MDCRWCCWLRGGVTMWPQPIYINIGGATVEVLCGTKGTTSFTGAGQTIPTPCGEPGDFQVLIASSQDNTTPNWASFGIGPEETDWLVVSLADGSVFDETYGGGLPTPSTVVLMRKLGVGAVDFGTGHALVGGGALTWKWVTYILRGLDSTYYPLAAHTISGYSGGKAIQTNTGATGIQRGPNPMPLMLYGLANDIVINHEHLLFGSDPNPVILPSGPNVLFADGHDPNGSSPHSSSSIVQKFPKPLTDLFANKTLADWNLINLTDGTPVLFFSRVVTSVGSGAARKAISLPNVTLTAGVTYRWTVRLLIVSGTTGSASLCPFLTIVDPQNVEHGVGSNMTNTNGVRGTLMTTNAWSVLTLPGFAYDISLYFTPVETGNYEFRVSMSRQDQLVAGDLDACTLSASNSFRLNAISLWADDTGNHIMPQSVRRDASWPYWNPTAQQLKLLGRRQSVYSGSTGYSSNNSVTSQWSTLATTPERPVCEMSANWAGETISGVSPDKLSVIATPVRMADIGSNELWTWQSSTCVYPQLGDAFYYEVTIDQTGTGRWGVLSAAPTHDANSQDTSTSASDWYNHYWYEEDGTAQHWTTSVSGLATLSAGDVLGVAIRFDIFAVEFYVNGVLQVSFPMEDAVQPTYYNPRVQYCIWRAFGGLYLTGNQTALYTMNFKGPWTYPTVAGTAPFDWAHQNDFVYRVGMRTAEGTVGPSTPKEFFYPPGTTSGDLIICYIYSTLALDIAGLPANTTYVGRNQGYSGNNEGLLNDNVAAYWIAGSEKSVTLTDIANLRSILVSMAVYRNVNQTHPIGELVTHYEGATWHSAVATSDLTGASKTCSAAWLGQRPNGSADALRAYMLFPTDFIDDSTILSAPWETPGSGLREYTHPWTGGGARIVSYEGNTGTPRTAQNLLQYARRGMDSWTLTNITNINNNATSGDETVTQFDLVYDPVLPTEHYWSQVVNLEAGKWYTFVSHVKINSYYGLLAVDDGVSGLRGAIFGISSAYTAIGTPSNTYFGMTQWTPTNNVAAFWRHCGLYFKAEVTGPHTVRCGVAYQLGTTTWPASAQPPGGAHQFYGASLVEGFYPHIREAFMPVGATNGSVIAGTGALITNPVGWTSNKRFDMLEYEVVPTTATPADVVLYGLGQHHNVQFTDDLLETKSSLFAAGNEMPTAVATHPATPGGKHYVEVTVVSLEVANWTVGLGIVTPFVQGYTSGYSPIYTLDQEGFWSYSQGSGGELHDDGVDQTSVGAALTPGDVVGIAADLTLGQITFYKNGVQVGTTMTGIPTNQLIQFYLLNMSQAQTDSTTNRLRVNFKGPFSYPVVGFSPWQWW